MDEGTQIRQLPATVSSSRRTEGGVLGCRSHPATVAPDRGAGRRGSPAAEGGLVREDLQQHACGDDIRGLAMCRDRAPTVRRHRHRATRHRHATENPLGTGAIAPSRVSPRPPARRPRRGRCSGAADRPKVFEAAHGGALHPRLGRTVRPRGAGGTSCGPPTSPPRRRLRARLRSRSRRPGAAVRPVSMGDTAGQPPGQCLGNEFRRGRPGRVPASQCPTELAVVAECSRCSAARALTSRASRAPLQPVSRNVRSS